METERDDAIPVRKRAAWDISGGEGEEGWVSEGKFRTGFLFSSTTFINVLQTLGVGFCNFNSFILPSDQQCNGQRFFKMVFGRTSIV